MAPKARGAAQKRKVAETSAKVQAKDEAVDLRGLLINSLHIHRFFAPVLERKTHEVRNFCVRCVRKGDEVFLVESGVKDQLGRGVFRVWGRAEFRGTCFVRHEDFSADKNYRKHRCTPAEYEAVRKGWSNDKNGCYLWEFILREKFEAPLYLKPNPGQDPVELSCWEDNDTTCTTMLPLHCD